MSKPLFFLLADDDEDDQNIFMATLHAIDPSIECVTVSNGKEAVTLLGSDFFTLPDYIFLDLNMPLMNGLKCLEEIKKMPLVKEVPVVIYSTTTEKKFVDESLKAGAFQFFIKPPDSRGLLNYLEQLIGLRQ